MRSPGEDADPVTAHLAGGVAEGLVAVVELDPVHAVPERLDDLALHVDLLFFSAIAVLLSSRRQHRGGGGPR